MREVIWTLCESSLCLCLIRIGENQIKVRCDLSACSSETVSRDVEFIPLFGDDEGRGRDQRKFGRHDMDWEATGLR